MAAARGTVSIERRSNNSFKPNLLRYTNSMAGKACRVVGSATQVGLIQALDLMERFRMRTLISSGSPLEPQIGFSRAVRVGNLLAVAGTAPIASDGSVAAPGDVYGQTKRCLDIIATAISDAGLRMEDVIRTRIMLTDIESWRDAARAHGESFAKIKPVCTFVEVARFIDPGWLVEVEADCIVGATSGP